ncbi:P-loop NTPase fold protein [Roseateles paludis]|uniref:P-loop NTPase fold protein n=1 Tax=Roseateles paludis TaxID=3145238 RepID=A0ABV0FWG3_9BURK
MSHAPLAFGHAALVTQLADELQDSLRQDRSGSMEPALVVGVFGEWGSGKSRLLTSVEDELRRRDAARPEAERATALTVIVPFNAWRYEREEHLLVPLLRVAEQQLRKALDASLPQDLRQREQLSDRLLLVADLAQTIYSHGGRELLQAALTVQGVALKLPEIKAGSTGAAAPGLLGRWKALREAQAQARRLQTPISALHSLYYDFLEHLRAVTGRNPKALALHRERLKLRGLGWWPRWSTRVRTALHWLLTGETPAEPQLQVNLVFLVDDLDRCLPDKAVEVLEAIKLFLEVEGCAFVLALDEEVVERGIAHRYKDYALQGKEGLTPITGAEYLEKLVHLPIRLPRPTPTSTWGFLAAEQPAWFADANGQPNELAKLVGAITPAVPRKLKRMVALLETAEELGAGDETLPERREWLAIACALQLFAPALFRYLRLRGPALLITLAEWRRDVWFKDLEALRKKLKTQQHRATTTAALQVINAKLRLPELCEQVMQNRSGFDLLELLGRVDVLHARRALQPAQLGALLAFTETEDAVAPEAAPSDGMPAASSLAPSVDAELERQARQRLQDEQMAQARRIGEGVADQIRKPAPAPSAVPPALPDDLSAGWASGAPPLDEPPASPDAAEALPDAAPSAAAAPEVSPVEQVFGAPQRWAPPVAALEHERGLLEALLSGEPEVIRVQLSREGRALDGRLLPEPLVDEWLAAMSDERLDRCLAGVEPYLSQRAVFRILQVRRAQSVRAWNQLRRPNWSHGIQPWNDGPRLQAPPISAQQVEWLASLGSEGAETWAVPMGWRTERRQLWRGPMLAEGYAYEMHLGADERFGVYLDLIAGATDDRVETRQRLRWVPPGEFVMGSPTNEDGRDPAEGQLRTVELTRGYWIADTACTQGLWRAVMQDEDPRAWLPKLDRLPVQGVSPQMAELFCQRLAAQYFGSEVRLPSEAEWECACRAGTRGAFALAVATRETINVEGLARVEVGSRPPNVWGLYEMHGNVAEICRDLLTPQERAPNNRTDPEGMDKTGLAHALRGGSSHESLNAARSAAFDAIGHEQSRPDAGFRFILRAAFNPPTT